MTSSSRTHSLRYVVRPGYTQTDDTHPVPRPHTQLFRVARHVRFLYILGFVGCFWGTPYIGRVAANFAMGTQKSLGICPVPAREIPKHGYI